MKYDFSARGGKNVQYMVETKNLRKVYRTGDEKVVALDNIDLTIEQGQVCCILGTSSWPGWKSPPAAR